jgi:hypothetical protein
VVVRRANLQSGRYVAACWLASFGQRPTEVAIAMSHTTAPFQAHEPSECIDRSAVVDGVAGARATPAERGETDRPPTTTEGDT